MPEFKKPQQGSAHGLLAILILFCSLSLGLVGAKHTSRDAPANANSAHAAGPIASSIGSASVSARHSSILDVLAKPLFIALKWIHDHIVANWGWSILALTLCVNLAMMPMRLRSMRSQLKLQRLQPEIAAIKARFSGCKPGDSDMQKMNQEIFALQKREGVSLFGNLLAFLVQAPLLYGFYRMLRNAAELHQAQWFWLHDLSAPDPLHILPLFLLLTALLVQWLVPSPGADPMQRRITAFLLPLFSCLVTWKVGAGLALYWSCGNLVNIVQQVVVTRTNASG
jgi:YidC/Oxa1 family membrane protein insertase